MPHHRFRFYKKACIYRVELDDLRGCRVSTVDVMKRLKVGRRRGDK